MIPDAFADFRGGHAEEYSWYENAARVDLDALNVRDPTALRELQTRIELSFNAVRGRLPYAFCKGEIFEYVNTQAGYRLRVSYGHAAPQKPGDDELARTDKQHWVTFVFDYKGEPYLFGPRGWFYGDYHMSLGSASGLHKRLLTRNQLELMIILARVLGPQYEGFQNRVADSQDHYHVQFLRRVTTIWDASPVANFPATADVLEGSNYHELADRVLQRWTTRAPEVEFDLLLKSDTGHESVILLPRQFSPVPRKRPRRCTLLDDGFLPEDEHMGDFGTLELGGYLGTLRSRKAYEFLSQANNRVRYDRAIREVTWRFARGNGSC